MSRTSATMTLLVPNLLTLCRFPLAAAFPIVDHSWWPALLALAAASDAVDGAFSRLFHATSAFGQLLDPIADKTFVGVVLATLLANHLVSVPVLLLVAARDLAVGLGVVIAVLKFGRQAIHRMPPRLLGKATTALQFAFLFWVSYDRSVPIPLLCLTGAVSIAAGIDYLRNPHWSKHEGAARRVASDDATADV